MPDFNAHFFYMAGGLFFALIGIGLLIRDRQKRMLFNLAGLLVMTGFGLAHIYNYPKSHPDGMSAVLDTGLPLLIGMLIIIGMIALVIWRTYYKKP
jgi:uncharacterized protein involved in response to NO